ncbi:MAG: hypothetical protein Q4E35_02550 [Eubacteriales bacterium]|nr:hypothetical protein [Eubacteriales bacterium]
MAFLLFIAMVIGENAYIAGLHVSDEVRVEIEAFWKYEKYRIALVPIIYLLLQMLYADTLICNISNAVLFFFGISLSVLFSKLYGTTGVGLGMCIGTALAILVLCIHFFEIKCIFKFKWHLSWTVLRLTLPMQIRI